MSSVIVFTKEPDLSTGGWREDRKRRLVEEAERSMGEDTEVRLTDRELEVLIYISEGWTSHQVADKLMIGKKTVDYHLSKIYTKLEVSSRIQAFAKAASLGLIPRKPKPQDTQEESQSSN